MANQKTGDDPRSSDTFKIMMTADMGNLIDFFKTFQCLYETFKCNANLTFILSWGQSMKKKSTISGFLYEVINVTGVPGMSSTVIACDPRYYIAHGYL